MASLNQLLSTADVEKEYPQKTACLWSFQVFWLCCSSSFPPRPACLPAWEKPCMHSPGPAASLYLLMVGEEASECHSPYLSFHPSSVSTQSPRLPSTMQAYTPRPFPRKHFTASAATPDKRANTPHAFNQDSSPLNRSAPVKVSRILTLLKEKSIPKVNLPLISYLFT